MFFSSTYEHSLDDKGRVAIPARYRHLFADGGFLVQGNDGCLEVYAASEFERMAQRVSGESPTSPHGRRLRRGFFARAWDIGLDRQGRILVPAALREWAGLNGPVVLAGRLECLEIWSPERWAVELEQLDGNGE